MTDTQLLGTIEHMDPNRIEVETNVRTVVKIDPALVASIREFGGGVVLEAMALGVTPIVAHYGGPAELVGDSTGIRVTFTDRKSLVDGFHQAIARLVQDPNLLNELGSAARQSVIENLTWDTKAKRIAEIYRAVLAGKRNLRYLDLHLS